MCMFDCLPFQTGLCRFIFRIIIRAEVHLKSSFVIGCQFDFNVDNLKFENKLFTLINYSKNIIMRSFLNMEIKKLKVVNNKM